MATLTDIRPQIDERLGDIRRELNIVGYVGAIYLDGDSVEFADGVANKNTGAPMTPDTRFLLGSVSKVWVTTLLMRFVEKGLVNLDARVAEYLPELRLGDPDTRGRLTVRHLLNHTSGIDAADYAPDFGHGDDAIARYVAALANKGQVHPIGEFTSYCNPAFIISGRILEVLTGQPFDVILKRELFAPLGLIDSCTSGDEAILHRTAIGHLIRAGRGEPEPVDRFMLPYSMAPAGSRIITTAGDLLRFGRMHVDSGRTPDGDEILSADSVALMATESAQALSPTINAVGLGWQLPNLGGTRALSHSGGSYGGLSHLLVLPEHNFVLAGFGNASGSGLMHDRIALWLLEDLFGIVPPAVKRSVTTLSNPARYIGTYLQLGVRSTFSIEEGDLVMRIGFEYESEEERELHMQYRGGQRVPPVPLEPVSDTLFMMRGQPLDSLRGPYGRAAAITFLDERPARDGAGTRFGYRHYGTRIARRVA